MLLAGEKFKNAKPAFNISPVGAFFYACASDWGNVTTILKKVLLAGEMLNSAKPTFNISPVGALLLGGVCASGWANVKNCFENVLLAGEMF